MKNIFIVLSFLICVVTACDKTSKVGVNIPACIEARIKQIESEPARNPPASVWQFEYNGQTVFYIPPYCCDMYGDLYDSNCKLICHPDGGIAGRGDGKCTDFIAKKTNGKLIWQDTRK